MEAEEVTWLIVELEETSNSKEDHKQHDGLKPTVGHPSGWGQFPVEPWDFSIIISVSLSSVPLPHYFIIFMPHACSFCSVPRVHHHLTFCQLLHHITSATSLTCHHSALCHSALCHSLLCYHHHFHQGLHTSTSILTVLFHVSCDSLASLYFLVLSFC